ncbi:hypothetical protein pb186bvf_010425 [Paramecium bursaria]
MKTIALILLVAASAYALDASKFAVLLQAGTRSNDAVESVYNLLRDLKTENVNVQAAADKKNNTDEAISASVIADLTTVSLLNKKNYDNLAAVRADVEAQIRDTYGWLNFAEGRLAEIARKTESLQELRCYANALFVKSLADHQDAINVVQLLKQDVSGYITGGAAFIQTSSIADRLSSYSHLFQQDAIKRFAQLASSNGAESKRDGTVGQQVFDILTDLENELATTLAHLQEQEIISAFALAKWVSDTGAEKAWLETEHERKTAFLEKLEVQLPAVLASQAKALKVWKNSQLVVQAAQQDLEEKREFYAEETARRAEENAIIDLVIQIFKEQVRALASQTSLKRK